MSEHNLPWVYRPREFDDWGWIRDAAGNLAACARGDDGRKSHDQHRADGTDPYGEYAALIVKAVNNHEAMDKLLAEAADFLNVSPTMDGMDIGAKITQFRLAMQKAGTDPVGGVRHD